MKHIFKNALELELIRKIEEVLVATKCSVRDVRFIQSQPSILRVTLDSKEADKEVGITECQEVHQLINPMFDVWDPIETAYLLEVSSPGERAPLRTEAHFQKALGSDIEFKTVEPIELPEPMKPRTNWKVSLKALYENGIEVEDYSGVHKINYEKISQARWMRNWLAKDKK